MGKDFTPQVTKELQNALLSNERIANVYFDSEGKHYFKKHLIDLYTADGNGEMTSVKKVESLPGAKFGIVKIRDKKGNVVSKRVNVSCIPVAAEMTREEVLTANAVKETMSEKKKLEILAQAAEIMKEDNTSELLAKLNGGNKKGKKDSE